MGFSISWLAFKGLDRDAALHRTGLRATGKAADYTNDQTPFVFSALATGWALIVSNDYRYASAKGLAHVSSGATVVGCQVEEHIMASAAALFVDGREIWRIDHDSERGHFDLHTEGVLPPEFEAIRARLFAKQEQDRPNPFRTDYIFDVPVELAAAHTGYRHDVWRFDWGIPQFEAIEFDGATQRER